MAARILTGLVLMGLSVAVRVYGYARALTLLP